MREIALIVLMLCIGLFFAPDSEGNHQLMTEKTLILQTLNPETIDPAYAEVYDTSQVRIGQMVLGNTGVALYSVEKPFVSNPEAPPGLDAGKPYVSAVPLGEYILQRRVSPNHGDQWHFYNPALGVMLEKADCTQPWHRFSTMSHVANRAFEVMGCQGYGLKIHNFGADGGLGVASSTRALLKFKQFMGGAEKARLLIV